MKLSTRHPAAARTHLHHRHHSHHGRAGVNWHVVQWLDSRGLCLTDLTQLKPHPNLISTHQSIAETSPKHQHCLQGEISSKLCPKPILTSKPTVGRRKKVETWIISGRVVGKGATNVVEQNGKVVQKMQIRKLGNEKKVRTTLVWQSWPTNWYGGEGLLN